MNKKILITGGVVGIGEAIARKLAPNNHLLLHYHSSAAAAEALLQELRPVCASIGLFQSDLSTEPGCLELAEEVNRRFTSLDVLVNNAGGMVARQSVKDLQWEHLEKTFALNVYSTMKLTALCTERLLKGDSPTVINMTSVAVRHGAPSATAYGAAKSAIDAFTRGAAVELAPRIRVNAVAPGIIDTQFHARVTSKEKMAQFIESTPLKRAGNPEEIAHVVQFLIDNEFLTGATVDCNGGIHMR